MRMRPGMMLVAGCLVAMVLPARPAPGIPRVELRREMSLTCETVRDDRVKANTNRETENPHVRPFETNMGHPAGNL